MTDQYEDDEDETSTKRRVKDEGEGDSDSFGRGKAGAGSGMRGHRLPPQKLKDVMADWRHLDLAAVVDAVAEFFCEMPMRASANLSVAWKQTKRNARSFALVNWVVKFGHKAAEDLLLKREKARDAGRDTRGLKRKRAPGLKRSPGMSMGPHPSQQ